MPHFYPQFEIHGIYFSCNFYILYLQTTSMYIINKTLYVVLQPTVIATNALVIRHKDLALTSTFLLHYLVSHNDLVVTMK